MSIFGHGTVKPRTDSPGVLFPSPCERRNATLHFLQPQHADAQVIGIRTLTFDEVLDVSCGLVNSQILKLRGMTMSMLALSESHTHRYLLFFVCIAVAL